ncbi:MAG: acyl-CoA dehydrogenase family protein [Dehalococcoidales bacterium]|nr:acyl-CoA dehydrogenase family protein [Dehalococcoidales bacterium]
MDFTLTEEQKRLQATVKEFAEKKLAPIADELDRKQEFPWANFKAAAGLGLTGLGIPVEYGGSGGSKVDAAIAFEETARACVSTAGIINAHLILCAEPIYIYGTEKQRRKFLPPLAKGEKVGAFAITEADAGSDISGIKTTAVKDGDSYIINGGKVFITNGDVAGTLVIFAGIPALGKRGMTAFIIEDGMPGFIKGKKYDKLGMRALTNCELVFENCRVPVDNRLGEEGQGMKICLSTLDRGRIAVAAQGVGIARAVLEKSADYAKKRVQFGAPISQNQAISWMLADMATQLEAARLLMYKAASLADQGQPFGPYAAMAKLYATELGMKASTEGIQIHGGYGYMMDSPMQRLFRDAKLTTIYEGTSEVQRMVIARSVLQ